MKSIMTLMVLAFGLNAAAVTQQISCAELNKSGSVKKNGTRIELNAVYSKAGNLNDKKTTIQTENFFREGMESEINPQAVNFGKSPVGTFTNFFFYGDIMEYQLQFETDINGQNFENLKATWVWGVDESSSEPTPFYGIDMLCSGQIAK